MEPEFVLLLADRIGVFVFALSGGILAVRKRMDIFGVVVLACLPAIGGGTLRDLILDVPVFWLEDTTNITLALIGGIVVFLAHPLIERINKPLRIVDAFGMALFAVAGAAKTYGLGLSLPIVLTMGTMTACAGGLIRDVVANEDPLLLRQDIYATAALLAALVFVIVITFGHSQLVAYGFGIGSGFALRVIAIRYQLSLPRAPFRHNDNEP